MEDNSHAGQGSVLLDIGGEIGALVVTMPAEYEGREIEIRPVPAQHPSGPAGAHVHDHTGPHSHDDPAEHGHQHLVHVGVLGRPAGGRIIHSAVFGELAEGRYELYVRPDGPVQLTADVIGGQVCSADWPVSTSG